jgi:uncharacterized protein YdgA (DUF945 family)
MRMYARIAILFIILIALLLVSPLIIGFYLERNYPFILNVYSALPHLHISLERFHRGWFHSVANLHVELDSDVLEYINHPEQDTKPNVRTLIIEQRIQHGPIFYRHLKELPYFIGLAAIQNNLYPIAEMDNIIHVIKDIDYVSFRGNYYKYFKLAHVNLVYPRSDMNINIDKVEGYAWISTKQKKIQGNSFLQGIVFHNPDVRILIPSVRVQFDNDARLWLGNDGLTIPSISLIENEVTTASIQDLRYKGFSEVTDGMMSGSKDVFIRQINIGDYQAGPLRFNISAKKFNADAVDDMIEAYHLIKKRGELYQSQLTQKMIMMLPEIFNKGTTISLHNLDLKTQDGQLNLNGEVIWTMDKASIPDQISDILSAADVKMYLKIAKPLMSRWIEVASSLPWFNQVSPELDQFYNFARYEMMLTMQLNTFGVLDLVAQGNLSESDAKKLLLLQKTNVSTLNYAAAVKELLLNRIISRETSYMLLYLYTEGQAPLDSIRFLLQRNKQKVIQSMSLQLEEWIKSGYIQQQQNDYVISFVRQKNHTTFNGHSFSQ